MASNRNPVLRIADQSYLLYPTQTQIHLKLSGDQDSDFLPITAVSWDKAEFARRDLSAVKRDFARIDDVWTPDFLKLILLLQTSKRKCSINSKRVIYVDNSVAKLPNGPLAIEIATGSVYHVAKLVPDTHKAFLTAICPTRNPKANFCEVFEIEPDNIPIPSRLYFKPGPDKPLAGLRVAVKDTIALKGLRTGYGNTAWRKAQSPELTTAPCVKLLLDAGAVILGKVKTTEFAEGVDPCEWIDTECPFNPRGDGQQKPSASSSGSAVAVAAYPWLDVSIGTDTGGSIRHPAGVNGIFGQRPTHGRVSLEGVFGAADLFNTVGIFARDCETFSKVGRYLVEPTKVRSLQPMKRKYNLLYPTRSSNTIPTHKGHQHRWFPHPEADVSTWSEAEKAMNVFVQKLECLLECVRLPFNIDELWQATPFVGHPKSLGEATGTIYSALTTSGAIDSGIGDFLSKYSTEHGGEKPRIGDLVRRRLDYGKEVSLERIATSLESTRAFREWALSTLFGSHDQNATTIMIFPQSCGRPDYRDEVPDRSVLFDFESTFSIYSFGYLVGCPDYTIPIAEVPYLSKVTKRTEHLPVSISLVGAPGADNQLFELVDLLKQANVLSDVKAGSRMYDG